MKRAEFVARLVSGAVAGLFIAGVWVGVLAGTWFSTHNVADVIIVAAGGAVVDFMVCEHRPR